MGSNKMDPVHPGEILAVEFMEPLGLSNYQLAKELGVSQNTVGRIVNGTTSVTPRMAVLLGKRFKTSAKVWLHLQTNYDLAVLEDMEAAEKAKAKKRKGAA